MSEKLSLWDLYKRQGDILALLNTHNHDASDLTGLANVAISGEFNDLKNIPSLVNSVNKQTGNVTLDYNDVNAISKNASCNKNWNYVLKHDQPSYVWGCNDSNDMFIYNPSTFRVNNANSADYAASAGNAGNSNKLNGYSLDQIKQLIKETVKQEGGDYMGKKMISIRKQTLDGGGYTFSNPNGGFLRLSFYANIYKNGGEIILLRVDNNIIFNDYLVVVGNIISKSTDEVTIECIIPFKNEVFIKHSSLAGSQYYISLQGFAYVNE